MISTSARKLPAGGVDRNWLDQALATTHDGNDHCAYPILKPYPLPERMRLYIQARLTTAGGTKLEGYVMNDNAATLTVFVGDDAWHFARNATFASDNERACATLKQAACSADDPVFPMAYETDFLGDDDRLIQGTFHWLAEHY